MYIYTHTRAPCVNKQKPFAEGTSTVRGIFLLQQSKQSRFS